jgi:hypothetical protein
MRLHRGVRLACHQAKATNLGKVTTYMTEMNSQMNMAFVRQFPFRKSAFRMYHRTSILVENKESLA